MTNFLSFPFFREPKLKVLFVGAEAAPFGKAGGLGSVMFSLTKALEGRDVDVRMMIPRYASIDPLKFRLAMEYEGLEVPTDAKEEGEPRSLVCNVKKFTPVTHNELEPVTTYFLENQEYYEKRVNIYGYSDDATRFALFSRGTLEFLRMSKWRPDIIVASDWQTGFLLNYLRTTYQHDERLNGIATVFIIHNLFYQGMFDHRFISEADFDDGRSPVPSLLSPRLAKMNAMRRGILYADAITTVSPTYAHEIMEPEQGEALHELLRERRPHVHGILNGIDYREFDPNTDAYLKERYGRDSLERRAKNKIDLQDRFSLKKDPDAFVCMVNGRLVEQKGIDLLMPIAEPLFHELPLQLVVSGIGEPRYMTFFQELEKKFPGRVAANFVFDPAIPHAMYGGGDAILIPSKFEPSGLTQMEAMRYGVIPIVRATGGLADTVHDFHPGKGIGDGFVFHDFEPTALLIAIVRAYENFKHPGVWHGLQHRAMAKDFSWGKSAIHYRNLFEEALILHLRSKKAAV